MPFLAQMEEHPHTEVPTYPAAEIHKPLLHRCRHLHCPAPSRYRLAPTRVRGQLANCRLRCPRLPAGTPPHWPAPYGRRQQAGRPPSCRPLSYRPPRCRPPSCRPPSCRPLSCRPPSCRPPSCRPPSCRPPCPSSSWKRGAR
jgi:hypothetical protein